MRGRPTEGDSRKIRESGHQDIRGGFKLCQVAVDLLFDDALELSPGSVGSLVHANGPGNAPRGGIRFRKGRRASPDREFECRAVEKDLVPISR